MLTPGGTRARDPLTQEDYKLSEGEAWILSLINCIQHLQLLELCTLSQLMVTTFILQKILVAQRG